MTPLSIRFAGFFMIAIGLTMKVATLPLSEALRWMTIITAAAIAIYVVGVLWVFASAAREQRRR